MVATVRSFQISNIHRIYNDTISLNIPNIMSTFEQHLHISDDVLFKLVTTQNSGEFHLQAMLLSVPCHAVPHRINAFFGEIFGN